MAIISNKCNMNVDPRKSGASVNGKELKDYEMHYELERLFLSRAFF